MPADASEIRVHLAGATVVGKIAKWSATPIPDGFTLIGDVVRGDGTGGYLLRLEQSGQFMCWDGSVLTDLPQRRTREVAAKAIPGALEDRRPFNPAPLRALSSRVAGGSRYR